MPFVRFDLRTPRKSLFERTIPLNKILFVNILELPRFGFIEISAFESQKL